MSLALEELIRKQVIPRFPVAADAAIRPLEGGLINRTFLLSEVAGGRRFVLQQVHRVFPPSIHRNIRAVTEALARAGLTTQRLIATVDGQDYLELPAQPSNHDPSNQPSAAGPAPAPAVWRLMSYVEGHCFDVVGNLAQARSAGELVARFHSALFGLAHQFVGLRQSVHDTPRHLATLAANVAGGAGHRLYAQTAPLAAAIAATAAALPPLPPLPPTICHGDLKFNNLLFAETTSPGAAERAVCLIDLDTVGPMPLAYELGDAWRSWCNRSGEDRSEADLDLEIFASSLDGYLGARTGGLGADERRALLLGPEWISLELAARFAADALAESYFGWDSRRFPGRGEHNLLRARGQFSLHQAFAASRPRRAQRLGIA